MRINTLLFVPAPIASHLVPALALAKRLKRYHVSFAVPTIYIEEVQQAGFNVFALDAPRFGIGDDPYVLQRMEHNKTPNYWREVKFYFSNSTYNQRKISLNRILDIVQPYGVLLDLFSSTDFIIIHRCVKRVIFVSPMLSTHKAKGFPSFRDDEWTKTPIIKYLQYKIRYIHPRMIYDLFNGFNSTLILWYNFLRNRIPLSHSLRQQPFGLTHFRNTAELVLAPLELEFSSIVRDKKQQYLGLVIDERRIDTNLDPLFEMQYIQLIERKKTTQLVYCSFGTYGANAQIIESLINFTDKLRQALANRSDITIILAIHPVAKTFLSSAEPWPENFFVYAKVPQLRVLALADVFITHAGLGSIKEAIYFGVPLLALPLDPTWDQDGNALKIEYHRLGIRGSIADDTAQTLVGQIDTLLTDNYYRNNVEKLRQRLLVKYPEGYEDVVIDYLFS